MLASDEGAMRQCLSVMAVGRARVGHFLEISHFSLTIRAALVTGRAYRQYLLVFG